VRVLFLVKGDLRFFYPALAQAVKRRGCEVIAITSSSVTDRALRNSGIFTKTFCLAESLKRDCESLAQEECDSLLSDLDELMRPLGYNCLIYADRIIRSYPFERVDRMIAATYRFLKSVLEETRPDAIFAEIACAAEWIASELARSLKIPYLAPYPTPIANSFYFIDCAQGMWEPMVERYDELKQRGLSELERQRAEDFLRSLREKKTKPAFLAPALRSPFRLNPRRLLRRIQRIPFRLGAYFEDGSFDICSYDGKSPWLPVREDVRRLCRHLLTEWLIFDSHPKRGKSVYFPLHVQPEFTTDVRAPFFVNQVAVIESLARTLPPGYLLVVKEHPGMKGERSLSYYQAIKSLYNVQLVSPNCDSHDLIRASDLVVTIVGSTAWEAALYEKPVIALGQTCYNCPEFIHNCPVISELPELVRSLLKEFRPDTDALHRLVTAVRDPAYRGMIGNGITDPRVMDESNLELVATAVVREAERIKRKLSSDVSVSAPALERSPR
jgi:hypothetical protein